MMRGGVRGPDMADVFGTGAGQYGNGFASQKCGGAKVTIRSLLLCGDRDIDIHRLRTGTGWPLRAGPQALKLVKRFVETSLKSGFVTGELTKCITLFRVGDPRTRWNNLQGGLAVRRTVGPGGHANSPPPPRARSGRRRCSAARGRWRARRSRWRRSARRRRPARGARARSRGRTSCRSPCCASCNLLRVRHELPPAKDRPRARGRGSGPAARPQGELRRDCPPRPGEGPRAVGVVAVTLRLDRPRPCCARA
jgi:hypothetical protein